VPNMLLYCGVPMPKVTAIKPENDQLLLAVVYSTVLCLHAINCAAYTVYLIAIILYSTYCYLQCHTITYCCSDVQSYNINANTAQLGNKRRLLTQPKHNNAHTVNVTPRRPSSGRARVPWCAPAWQRGQCSCYPSDHRPSDDGSHQTSRCSWSSQTQQAWPEKPCPLG